jgi:hypothetical protein
MDNETIEQLHQHLNRSDILPDEYYRRNHVHYTLVCYINNIIGLYLSSNFGAIPVFIQRAHRHLEHIRVDEKQLSSDPYLELVEKYLSQMAKFVFSLETIDETVKQLIQSDLL